MAKISFILQKVLIIFIQIYRYLISPLLGQNCRFYPTCSKYAQEAIENYGIRQGVWLSIKRLLRCHPWHPGGYDPITHSSITNADDYDHRLGNIKNKF